MLLAPGGAALSEFIFRLKFVHNKYTDFANEVKQSFMAFRKVHVGLLLGLLIVLGVCFVTSFLAKSFFNL